MDNSYEILGSQSRETDMTTNQKIVAEAKLTEATRKVLLATGASLAVAKHEHREALRAFGIYERIEDARADGAQL